MGIEFRDLTKRFGERTVLDRVSLVVETGRVLFIIGASGTGKSVLMRHVIGLLKPDGGEVWVDGERVDPLGEKALYAVRRRCGFVFQHPTLLDFLTLEGNVGLPLVKRLGLRRADAAERARAWLARVGIEAEADRFPAEVGAGLQKRASIARTLALEPRYVVYDEPTTGLDPVSARRVDALIRRLADDTGVTSIVVSHDLTSIFSIADRIAFLYRGHLHAEGTAAELKESDDPIVRQFLSGTAEGPMVI